MEGPPEGTGTPRERRPAVLSRRGHGWRNLRRAERCFPREGAAKGGAGCGAPPAGHGWRDPEGHREPQKSRGQPSPKALLAPLPPRALSAHLRGRHCRHCSARTGTFQTRRSRGRRQRPLAGAARGSRRRAALGSGTRSGSRPSLHGPRAAAAPAPG